MSSPHPELIKDLYRIRKYLREFYIFGFRPYSEFDWKSKETYYDERMRIANWLGESMVIPSQGNKTEKDHISIPSRALHHNPLYSAWKSKAFTNGQLAVHFSILCAVTQCGNIPISKFEAHPDNYLEDEFSDNSVSNQLNKYAALGLMEKTKKGKRYTYKLGDADKYNYWKRALDFFSETAPCGVIGSFALDKISSGEKDIFSFKHNYMSSAIDDEIMANVFDAIHKKQALTIEYTASYDSEPEVKRILPMKVLIGASTGRNYVAAKDLEQGWMNSFRLDYIMKIIKAEDFEGYDEEKEIFLQNECYLWGVSFGNNYPNTERVSFTIKVPDNEYFVADRLKREKRNGNVTELGENVFRYEAEVFDSNEVVPWIRSFLGFITNVEISNEYVRQRFKESAIKMIENYEKG